MPGHDHDHDDDDKHGGSGGRLAGTSPTSTTTDQLVAAARALTTLSLQIDGILRTWVDPPEPDKPVAISATMTLQTQSAHITTTANAMMAKLRG